MIPSDIAEHPNVQIVEVHNPSRITQLEKCISKVFDEALVAYGEDQNQKTFIHAVYKGPATTEDGKIVIECKNGRYPLEERLYNEDVADAVMLWGIFDCPRDLPGDASEDGDA